MLDNINSDKVSRTNRRMIEDLISGLVRLLSETEQCVPCWSRDAPVQTADRWIKPSIWFHADDKQVVSLAERLQNAKELIVRWHIMELPSHRNMYTMEPHEPLEVTALWEDIPRLEEIFS